MGPELITGAFYIDKQHRAKKVVVITGFASLPNGFSAEFEEFVLFREFDAREPTIYALPISAFKRHYKKTNSASN